MNAQEKNVVAVYLTASQLEVIIRAVEDLYAGDKVNAPINHLRRRLRAAASVAGVAIAPLP